jgi:hypothetical protein
VFQKTDMPVARMTRCGFGRSGRWELQGMTCFTRGQGWPPVACDRGACVCVPGWVVVCFRPSLDKIHLQSRDAPARLSPLFGPLKLSVADIQDDAEPTGPT